MRKGQKVSFNASEISPETAALLSKHLAAVKKGQPASLKLGKGQEIPLPESLLKLISQALTQAAAGKKLLLVEEDEEVSPEKAAEFLRVSRPYLVKQLDAGAIPFHWVGTHRRIPMAELVAYKQQRRARSRALLQKMREEAEALGLYE